MSGDSTTTTSTSAMPDEFAPPDDFGAAVMAEFERRAQDSAVDTDADAPPGGWPEDTTPDAGAESSDAPDAAATDADSSATPEPVDSRDGTGEDDATAGAPSPEAPPIPGDDALAEGASSPSSESGDPEGASDPVPSGYTWQDGDQSVTFTDDQVQRAISIAAWAENLPDDLRNAFAAVETGHAVPIPRADYEQFVAWRNSKDRESRDGDLDSLDPDTAKTIAELRDEIASLKGQTPAAAQPPRSTGPDPEMERQFETAITAYGQERGITEDELTVLSNEAAAAGIIPALMQQHTTVSPTGQIIRPADIGQVTREALDFALVRNPALHEKVTARLHAASTGSHDAPTPGAENPSQPDPVLAKRARAASLATAPSAAVAPPPRSNQAPSPDELMQAMVADIEKAIAAS